MLSSELPSLWWLLLSLPWLLLSQMLLSLLGLDHGGLYCCGPGVIHVRGFPFLLGYVIIFCPLFSGEVSRLLRAPP